MAGFIKCLAEGAKPAPLCFCVSCLPRSPKVCLKSFALALLSKYMLQLVEKVMFIELPGNNVFHTRVQIIGQGSRPVVCRILLIAFLVYWTYPCCATIL